MADPTLVLDLNVPPGLPDQVNQALAMQADLINTNELLLSTNAALLHRVAALEQQILDCQSPRNDKAASKESLSPRLTESLRPADAINTKPPQRQLQDNHFVVAQRLWSGQEQTLTSESYPRTRGNETVMAPYSASVSLDDVGYLHADYGSNAVATTHPGPQSQFVQRGRNPLRSVGQQPSISAFRKQVEASANPFQPRLAYLASNFNKSDPNFEGAIPSYSETPEVPTLTVSPEPRSDTAAEELPEYMPYQLPDLIFGIGDKQGAGDQAGVNVPSDVLSFCVEEVL